MAIVGLDHVQLAIPSGREDEARAFFTGLLGMREVPKPDQLSPEGCWFESGSVRLHLGVDSDFVPARKAHPAFLIKDLADLRGWLQEAGFATRDYTSIEGYDRFFAADPFGNRLEFMQKTRVG